MEFSNFNFQFKAYDDSNRGYCGVFGYYNRIVSLQFGGLQRRVLH